MHYNAHKKPKIRLFKECVWYSKEVMTWIHCYSACGEEKYNMEVEMSDYLGRCDTRPSAKFVCCEISIPNLILMVIYLASQHDYSAKPHTTGKEIVPSADMDPCTCQ